MTTDNGYDRIPEEWEAIFSSDEDKAQLRKLAVLTLKPQSTKSDEEKIWETRAWHELAAALLYTRNESFTEVYFRLRDVDEVAEADGDKRKTRIGLYWYQVCKVTIRTIQELTHEISRKNTFINAAKLLPYARDTVQIVKERGRLVELLPNLYKDARYEYHRLRCLIYYILANDASIPLRKRMNLLYTIEQESTRENVYNKDDDRCFITETNERILPLVMHEWFLSVNEDKTAQAIQDKLNRRDFDRDALLRAFDPKTKLNPVEEEQYLDELIEIPKNNIVFTHAARA